MCKIFMYQELNRACIATASLFTKQRGVNGDPYRDAYIKNRRDFVHPPFNSEESLMVDFINVLSNINNINSIDNLAYWNSDLKYTPLDIFYGSIQFFDDHNADVPEILVPPADDIQAFVSKVKEMKRPAKVDEQFKILLDITNQNIIGAAHLGMMATRLYARGADKRTYEGIHLSPEDIVNWNSRIAPFEIFDKNQMYDVPGDTYYFWTQFFATLSLKSINSPESHAVLELFRNGNDIMGFVRKNIARQGQITPHTEASLLGYNLGIAVSEFLSNGAIHN